jgi:hypothetical protein
MIGLTSCEIGSFKKEPIYNIYQPSILSLEKGKSIITKDGIYTPQTDEVWHSDARFKKLENQLFYHIIK